MEIDLKRLEKEQPPLITQRFFLTNTGDGTSKEKVLLPIFDVTWGHKPNEAINVSISGINGELLKLRQEDDTYSMRPASLIKDMDKLLAIPDEEFLKYSDMERSNLVVRFAAVRYPPITTNCPVTKTNATTSVKN